MRINLVLATSLWEPHEKAGKLLSVPLAPAAAAPGAAMAPRQGLDVGYFGWRRQTPASTR